MKTNLLKIIGGLLFIAATSSPTFATDPSSTWNVAGQNRTDSCASMKYSAATLLFPDATPTGFYAQASDPSRNAGCGIGWVEIDAQEILYTGAGQDLYFHPGGGPLNPDGSGYYVDYVNNGQYGHIWVTDINARPTLKPQNLNGKGCSASTTPGTAFAYYITPTSIPTDMLNKPPANGGAKWYGYGNPGYDKTGGRGDWTYIVWSCVQT
ncbi:MAG: hypothetical protein ACR2H1_00215, partial [Limisphaerales bacterium]